MTWYIGIGSEAARERWAFAISAKEAWAPKLRADIAKLVATGRGYTKAFFVTNQAVSDRERAKAEDELTKKHGLDVRILDRTWILDRVFTERLQELAIEELSVTALERRDQAKGPIDTGREAALKEIDKRLGDAVAERRFGPHLPDAALEAAILARELERTRAEVDGRFIRAETLADSYGSERQRIEALYQHAWTQYWWFEDFEAFAAQYEKVEALAQHSSNPYDLERLGNLWNCLNGARAGGLVGEGPAQVPARTKTLATALTRLTKEIDRPSAALTAEGLLCQLHITEALFSGQSPDDHFRQMRAILLRSKGFVGFPLQPHIDIIAEWGDRLPSTDAFDELFEAVVALSATNEGEVRAARLLLRRGEQYLEHNEPIRAITVLGRSLVPLYKHETRHAFVG
jgi:hypothetical protein